MSQKKYASLSTLQTFLDNLKNTFANLGHKHTVSDITDYVIDDALSSTSTNPVQNKVLDTEFEEIAVSMRALDLALDGKSDSGHTHDDRYYTETEIDTKLSVVNTSIDNIKSGEIVVKESEHAGSADSATTANSANHATSADSATKATQDASGNVITTTYETKTDATAKLTEAKNYADSAASSAANTVKNDLLNGAGEQYDTLKELSDLINENTDALDALETIATGKADKTHTHAISDVTNLQVALDTLTENKSDKTHTHANATTTASGMMSSTDKLKLDDIEEKATNGIQRVNMSSEDGAVWTATIDGIEELTNGKTFLFIPNRTSSSTTPTLNVNGLGAVTVRRKMSSGTATLCAPNTSTLFFANRPTLLMYDTATMNGTPYWIALEFTKPSATDLYGKVPVQNGGWFSNSNTTDDDLAEARESFGVYSKEDQDLTLIYDSGEITEAVNSIAGINISGYKNFQIVVQNVNDGSNTSSAAGSVIFTAKNGTTYMFHTWSTLFPSSSSSGACGMAHFRHFNGWLMLEHTAYTPSATKNIFSETEGGSATKCSAFSGGALMRCTNELSTMAITSQNQSASNFFGVGSRVMVWGCKV